MQHRRGSYQDVFFVFSRVHVLLQHMNSKKRKERATNILTVEVRNQ